MTKQPLIKPGDVVYFKEVTREIGKASQKIGFKGGTGFAVMLGIVPPNGRPPQMSNLMMLMGSAGFMAFDDVAKFLGDEMGKKCVELFEKTYYPQPEKKSAIILPKEAMNGQERPKLILAKEPETEQ